MPQNVWYQFNFATKKLSKPKQPWRTAKKLGKIEHKSSKQQVPVSQAGEAEDLIDAQTKFKVVLETATLSGVDLAAYCSSKGLYVEQIAQWRAQCEASFNPTTMSAAERANAKRIQLLEREIARKEKQIAEAAALMILRKKAEAIWGLGEEQ